MTVLGSITLGECLPELLTLSAAFGSATVVYAVIDQVRLVTCIFYIIGGVIMLYILYVGIRN